MNFQKGDLIVYEHLRPNDGRKYACQVVGERDGWVLDVAQGTHCSASFKPNDVIIWEVHKPRGKK